MALTTFGLMQHRDRIIADIERQLFNATSTVAEAEPKPITPDTIREWANLALDRPEPPVRFIILDAQQQRRTPVTGHYYVRSEKPRAKLRKQGRKCSRRKWQAMNRRQWDRVPIYAEPTDVLQIDGKMIVTPRQHQALRAAIAARM